MKKNFLYTLIIPIFALAISSPISGSTEETSETKPESPKADSGPDAATLNESLKHAESLSFAFQHVATVLTPSVVTISAAKKVRATQGGFGRRRMVPNPFMDPFQDFFGDDGQDGGGSPMAPGQDGGIVPQGLGTGVIVDSSGRILTNNHVIADADELTVYLGNEKKFKAEIVGTDAPSDLAVIKIKANGEKLTPAKLGDSDALKIGEWVVAAGNPFGLQNTITSGIVSAKGRTDIEGSGGGIGNAHYEDFIQTDAAINPGNSGGPLANLHGEVIGINTAIVSKSGGYQGIGFAIPSNMAKFVMDSLINKGKVTRGWLGVSIQNVTEEAAESFGYTGTDGALVGDVSPGTPAEKAGMQKGDIITSFNGEKITTINQLRNLVARVLPGKSVPVEVARDGKPVHLDISIGELKSGEAPRTSNDSSTSDLGLAVETLTPEIARSMQSKHTSGVIVRNIRPGSPADKSGLQPMDIILSVNGTQVADGDSLKKLLTGADKKKVARLVVETQGAERFVFLKPGE